MVNDMLNEDRKELCVFRLEKSQESIESAEKLFEMKDYSAVVNMSYYSMFYAIRAIMALDGKDEKEHSEVITYFTDHYVNPEMFATQYSYIAKKAFSMFVESECEDFFVVSRAEATEQIENAKYFLDEVKKYVDLRVE